jgi:hypothetical protein
MIDLRLRELATMVRAMRVAQRNYFWAATQPNLAEAVRLEKAVDAYLKELLDPREPTLFDGMHGG